MRNTAWAARPRFIVKRSDPLRHGQQQVRIVGRDENKDLVGARMKSSLDGETEEERTDELESGGGEGGD